ncbi:hypothetical protein IAQ61_001544 [Plenodomus lingam]|uniref:uncharacterized protein n=1 Tax=Leptosphaeria maculans TaxID=5022 RepID=UPI003327875E|nr:hypothetical protein IAQ61_001544 [Plenodomus lingam]
MMNEDSFIYFYGNVFFKRKIGEEINPVTNATFKEEVITSDDISLLTKSCQWMINNRNAAWFDWSNLANDDDIASWMYQIVSLY